ncbi:hypothetical protein EZV61_05585 [Corallincola luteus]|uniref:PseI/NeuA/B-like domain-containing protein n=1 Tax=Corallincola luteus TaxID=1775177 RepID=A0ABY2AT83_9GAMM|nr:N-acetylneuraminate synthase family protein [Corallincola luteus]TCI05422.1 hypothetical protein EZV61_05585 [Corallincola luteus]
MLIIAETAFNHEGDFEYLLRLVDAAVESGADTIKFQVLVDVDEFVSPKSDAYDVSKSWCFSESQWCQAIDYAASLGMKIFMMPLDTSAVLLCSKPAVDFVEIHSVSFNDRALLQAVESLDKTIAFGIGGRTLEEVKALIGRYGEQRLLLMHGFQAYPTDIEDVCFQRISYLKTHYPDLKIGYADHSAPQSDEALESSFMAYARGIRIFEKHLTLEDERTDAQSALRPAALKKYVQKMHRFHRLADSLASNWQPMTEAETKYRYRQKQVVAASNIEQGSVFNEQNLCLQMHTCSGSHTQIEILLGKAASVSYQRGDVIDEN